MKDQLEYTNWAKNNDPYVSRFNYREEKTTIAPDSTTADETDNKDKKEHVPL